MDILRSAAGSLGIFLPARRLYRRVNPYVKNQFELDRTFFARFVRPGSLVFDLGANMGQKTEVFLALGAHVVVVEPNPNCVRYLKSAFGRHPRVHLVPKAVGAASGTAVLTHADTRTTGSLRSDWFALKNTPGRLEQHEVDVTTIPELIDQFGAPNYCKVDVEGFETEVVSAIQEPLSSISLEYHLREIDAILTCIDHLKALSDVCCNVAEMDGADLALDEWVGPDILRKLLEDGAVPYRGDVFIERCA